MASALLWPVRAESTASGGAAAAEGLQTLHCPPCERIHCTPRRALKLQCSGGVTTGICGCCPVCARTAGESCGGRWDYLGKCDAGLVCMKPEPLEDMERGGICRAGKAASHLMSRIGMAIIMSRIWANLFSKTILTDYYLLESTDLDNCRPDCTREYCQANPTEICSARSASLQKKDCHGACQHTSCSSCLILKTSPCPQECNPSDQSCLHRFGRCVHNHLSLPYSGLLNQDLQVQADADQLNTSFSASCRAMPMGFSCAFSQTVHTRRTDAPVIRRDPQ
ncbi:Venom protein 302 [Merluccius polli]|uniref:Venom protein 302 n=1 Tax=Merluccius polli TaxID=89951 RepID=A0AA47MEZ5_MERPO|nr:Venom protein 302 [Merluccius polli]